MANSLRIEMMHFLRLEKSKEYDQIRGELELLEGRLVEQQQSILDASLLSDERANALTGDYKRIKCTSSEAHIKFQPRKRSVCCCMRRRMISPTSWTELRKESKPWRRNYAD